MKANNQDIAVSGAQSSSSKSGREVAEVIPRPLMSDPRVTTAERLLTTLREEKELPGLACVVFSGGQCVWESAQGWADVENNVPFAAGTATRIASVSKTMTALALLRLHLNGTLDMDTPVGRYVPQCSHAITPRQLATHTSGMRHFRDNAEKKLAKHFPNTLEGIRWFMNDALEHAPGTKFSYSSFGYAVLGAVVEAVTGEHFGDHMQRTLFGPLGMTATCPEIHEELIPHRSRYYSMWTGALRNSAYVDNYWKLPGDGFLSSARDLAGFGAACLSPHVPPEMREVLWKPTRLKDGTLVDYGFGWKIFKAREGSADWTVGHGGDAVGATSYLLVQPERNLVLALVCNLSKAIILPTATTLLRLFAGDDPSGAGAESP